MKKKVILFITAIILILVVFGFIKMSKETNTRVKLETSQGEIIIELYSEMPVTVGNFKKLVEEGFYDGVIFHRVIDGFMLQGGDPTGTGTGFFLFILLLLASFSGTIN